MTSSFLENLKKAVENSEFNSEAAKKINDIDNLANEKFSPDSSFDDKLNLIEERLKQAGVKATLDEDERIKANEEYKKKMQEIKKEEELNLAIAEKENEIRRNLYSLNDMEERIQNDIKRLLGHIKLLEEGTISEDPAYGELITKINEIKLKYK
jgi:hypothetical protein